MFETGTICRHITSLFCCPFFHDDSPSLPVVTPTIEVPLILSYFSFFIFHFISNLKKKLFYHIQHFNSCLDATKGGKV